MNTTHPSSTAPTLPTAKYLQARISHLSLILLKRYNTLLTTAVDPTTTDDTSQATDTDGPPPMETASKQLEIEIETNEIIRAAEEVMVLTRSLKELWLFGRLDTIDEQKRVEAQMKALGREVREVRGELGTWLAGVDLLQKEETKGKAEG